MEWKKYSTLQWILKFLPSIFFQQVVLSVQILENFQKLETKFY